MTITIEGSWISCVLLNLWYATLLFIGTFVTSLSAQRSAEEIQNEEMEIFSKLYDEWKGPKPSENSTYKAIPKFYFKVGGH